MPEFIGKQELNQKDHRLLLNQSMIIGLFAMIEFIILVYSIFVAVVGEPLHQ